MTSLQQSLTDIRNKLYDNLPTGEVKVWDLIDLIKWHINDIDNLLQRDAVTAPVKQERLMVTVDNSYTHGGVIHVYEPNCDKIGCKEFVVHYNKMYTCDQYNALQDLLDDALTREIKLQEQIENLNPKP